MRSGIRISPSQTQRSDWQNRIERREESWEGVRHKIFEGMVSKEGYPQINVSINHMIYMHCNRIYSNVQECVLCGNHKAFLRCLECAPATAVFCTSCDETLHKFSPFHDREVWIGTHFIAVPPTTSIDEQSLQLKPIGSYGINYIIIYTYIYIRALCNYVCMLKLESFHNKFSKSHLAEMYSATEFKPPNIY